MPESFQRAQFDEIRQALPDAPDGRVRVGLSFVFSYLDVDQSTLAASLRRFLAMAEETDTPVVVQFDADNWWGARPELWNWWDPNHPGYNPANRENVEWTGWGPEHAIRIAWRNWGMQFRVPPPPNLMSPAYQKAWQEQLRFFVPIVLEWVRSLPADKKDLFVGIKVGHESSIGVNAWYYENGNALATRPVSEDPNIRLKGEDVTTRGVAQIGYAAVRSAGLRSEGTITEEDLTEVTRRHLEDQSRLAAELGVPRDRLFTHGAGWKDGELLYSAAVNRFSCPGWSFYKHASDPRQDDGVQRELKRSDAPWWGAAEWLYQGPREAAAWRQAIANTLGDPRCRLLCIFNWEGIQDSPEVLEGIRLFLQNKSCGTQPAPLGQ